MANLTLESAFRRLSLRAAQVCRQCRRSFASTPSKSETNMSGTRALADSLRSSPTSTSRANPTLPLPASSASSASSSSTVPIPSNQPTPKDLAVSYIRGTMQRNAQRTQTVEMQDLERGYSRADLERQQWRKWRVGDVYAPHDLTGVEQAKWKKRQRTGRQRYDVVDQLGLDPREHYKNFSIMSEYMTDMGRIKHSRETGLRPKNQRRMAKAIRRAIGIGLMPGVHKHPELLRIEMNNRQRHPA